MMGGKILCLNPLREHAIFWARFSKHSGCCSNAVLGPNSCLDGAISLYFLVSTAENYYSLGIGIAGST